MCRQTRYNAPGAAAGNSDNDDLDDDDLDGDEDMDEETKVRGNTDGLDKIFGLCVLTMP